MTSAGLLRPLLVQIRSETKNTTQPEAGDSNIVFFFLQHAIKYGAVWQEINSV
jgi:hypothetical protein